MLCVISMVTTIIISTDLGMHNSCKCHVVKFFWKRMGFSTSVFSFYKGKKCKIYFYIFKKNVVIFFQIFVINHCY
jgi:hypothetical protein